MCCSIQLVAGTTCVANRSKQCSFWSHHSSHAENNVHNMSRQAVATMSAPSDFHWIVRPRNLAQHQNSNMAVSSQERLGTTALHNTRNKAVGNHGFQIVPQTPPCDAHHIPDQFTNRICPGRALPTTLQMSTCGISATLQHALAYSSSAPQYI